MLHHKIEKNSQKLGQNGQFSIKVQTLMILKLITFDSFDLEICALLKNLPNTMAISKNKTKQTFNNSMLHILMKIL